MLCFSLSSIRFLHPLCPTRKDFILAHDKSLVRSSWLIFFNYILDLNFVVVHKNIKKDLVNIQPYLVMRMGWSSEPRIKSLYSLEYYLSLYSSHKLFNHCLYLIISHVFRVCDRISNGNGVRGWWWINPYSSILSHCTFKWKVLSKAF